MSLGVVMKHYFGCWWLLDTIPFKKNGITRSSTVSDVKFYALIGELGSNEK